MYISSVAIACTVDKDAPMDNPAPGFGAGAHESHYGINITVF